MDQDDGIDPEIAAAMGFGSFGAQPQNKRRKFTHNDTDTFVQGQKQGGTTRPSGSGSGANTTALGVRSGKPAEEEEEEGEEASQQLRQPKDHETGDDGSKDTAMQGIGQGQEAAKNKNKNKKTKGPPRGLADYIAWGNTVAEQPPTTGEAATDPAEPTTAVASSVADEPEQGTNHGPDIYSPGVPSGEELSALRRGVKNARGDVVYFLPSFIQDPWKQLLSAT